MEPIRLEYLLARYTEASANAEEEAELFDALPDAANRAVVEAWLDTYYHTHEPGRVEGMDPGVKEEILSVIFAAGGAVSVREEKTKVRRMPAWVQVAAAAVLLFAVAGGAYWLLRHRDAEGPVAIQYTGDVAPGKEGARLRLSDGKIVLTDTIAEGLIAVDAGMRIVKRNGRIVYERADGVAIDEGAMLYNEAIADRGQKTTVVLPDGSVVYLNAGSSLRYPVRFAGAARSVSMTGEAYFEVVHNEKQPFRVQAKGQLIEDVGTAFNVNAYEDEPVAATTLVEGAVRVVYNMQGKLLKPGQQAVSAGGELQVLGADVDRAVAWHNGIFSFAHADVHTVMRQLSRWYKVDVRYEGSLPDETFTGEMGQNLTLKEVLEGLKGLRVRFRIEEDRHIVIMP